jgi:AcrR family transcriptional regulator
MSGGKGDIWIEAGLAELARSGVEGVRVEVLAKNLGVTKGGFYRRFRDRAALLDGILQNWSAGRIAAIVQQTSLDGATARERLRAIIQLYSERMNTEGMAVELAIRQWARSDEAAAAAAASVDAARLNNVGQLYRATGLSPEEADAQAFLFYCFIFGQSLLFLERGPRKRAQLIAKSAEKLVDVDSCARPAERRPRRRIKGAYAVPFSFLLHSLQ